MKASITLQSIFTQDYLEKNPHIIIEDLVDYLEPNNFNPNTQKIGNIILLNGYATHEIIDFTPEEIAEQQTKALMQKESDLYIKRMQDAQRIWAGLSAEFRIAKQLGQMDDATENIILAELKPVLDIVVPFGQWKTGYQLLLGIGSSVIGQELYDKLHNIIWNYIQENYEEMEVSQLKQSINKL